MSKLVLITGISRGLGRAMAEEFIHAGCTVFGCARNLDAIAHFRQSYGNPHDFETLDVTNEAQVKSWRDRLLSHYDPPELLLNNAGLINEPAPVWEVPSAEFNRIIDVNIKGVANLIRQFVPPMIERKRGIIVNFSSGWGRSTSPGVAPYCATKWAIEGLTRSLAQELPSNMAAIPLNPGVINTDMLATCFGGAAEGYPSAQDWAKKAVPFLLKLQPKDNGTPLTVPI